MCGICGVIGKKELALDVLDSMMEKMRHRGPDGEGVYREPEANLGFRRLSIIDLEHGDQPMFNEDRNLVLVFNGEIYNYRELKKDLLKLGHVFATESDSECLLHAYEAYGRDMVGHLRGMFAFAIWDKRNQTLFAARDPFGIKPFYYYPDPDGALVFASEIKSILEYPDYEKKMNERALDDYLSFQYSVQKETFFSGICRLMPGSRLTWYQGEIQIEKYESIQLSPEKKGKKQREKALEEALEESVKVHMRSDVEVGVLLSGGVDSNYLMQESQVQKSFSVGFSEGDGQYSELNQIPERVGTESFRKIITASEYWDCIPKVMYYMDEPLADPSAEALYLVDQMASGELKVVLSGEGADELFGGYRIYREPRALRIFRLLSRRAKGAIRRRLKECRWEFKGKNFILRGCQPLERRYIGNAKIFSAEEKRKILKTGEGTPPACRVKRLYQRNRYLDPVSRMQEVDLNFWLQGDILLKADKMSMAHSLESRVPYLDAKVYQAAQGLTEGEKIRGKNTKVLFRTIAAKKVERQVIQKKKLGFPVPIRIWLKQPEYFEKVRESFCSLAAEQFFVCEELLSLLQEHLEDKRDNSRKIWTVYVFLVWYQVYFGKQ